MRRTSRGHHEEFPVSGSKLGRQQEHRAAAALLWISEYLHGLTSAMASIFGTGRGGSSAAECSQSIMAGMRQGFSKCLEFQSGSG